jgi:2-octaprenyl-6-methoxyphenol hydroxylase
MSATRYDLIIVGGGLVGGSLACALGRAGLRVALVEAVANAARNAPCYDERVIALSWGSRRILDAIGLWDHLAWGAEPILRVHVSDRGHGGCAHLDQAEEGVPALGYVVPARLIGQAIQAQLGGVDVLCPARLIGFRLQEDRVDVEVASAGESRLLSAALLVAADGGNSAIRQRLGFEALERRYGQDAIITTVTPDRPQPGVAFERFTATGPLALLPMTEGRYSLVWTSLETETAEILGLDDRAFIERLQARFGYRLGGLDRPGRRLAYPLKLMLTEHPVRQRLVLIGNAAHTLHPVAGQGLNLGLRDLAALAQIATDRVRAGSDPGIPAALEDYGRLRGHDQTRTGLATDFLAHLFVNPWPPLRLGRTLGLLGLDLVPGVRHRLAAHFMGIAGHLPRLARGLPL